MLNILEHVGFQRYSGKSVIANIILSTSLLEEGAPRQAGKVSHFGKITIQIRTRRYEVLCKIYCTAQNPPGNMS